ncbi:DUF2461 domain-containing protein [Chitinophaga sp. 30R24]|uniref:DUF2461 domain-containing protein n=1 Tax=Chitinophaga sp. 30R24 TaxID=3248838 RepID=UPI003B8F8B38
MLQPSTLKFLKSLRSNNNKVWFDEHKAEYLAAKADFEGMVQQLIDGLSKQDISLQGLQVKDCVFRIYKDVRFAKDKTPYKTHLGAFFQAGGKKSNLAGYYFHLEPGGHSMAGGGIWMPAAPELKKLRQEIDYNFEAFEQLISGKEFIKHFGKVEGEALKNAPQGYQPDHPAIAYLKLKSLIVSHPFTDEACMQSSIVKEILKTFSLMQPLIQFINRAMD